MEAMLNKENRIQDHISRVAFHLRDHPEDVPNRNPSGLTARCITCGKTKPSADFYCHPGKVNGLNSNCKKCSIIKSIQNYHDKSKDALEAKRPEQVNINT